METTAPQASAIDVAPKKKTAVIAFFLALLTIPGTTVAWDLPAGGLWIGLPLGIAAIVMGLRARRAGVGTGLAVAAIVIAGLCLLQMAIWTAVSLAT